ncbi:hypothetical protein CSB45_03455 [candidate division KSB3 bacterium]|uniref:AAA+ ATPase domain-containing protein n=1 Tax=candidate division KSB3 bacterium TaxID=2044937 RepID=A0A2G6E959_9BACT|nr:MAG: hypothetical protein CSB45_03455 [candidate division KSB3 bacterium]PIE29551.1 MAG: hypothetical protein CSA57_08050 [candidate division KSB3 bacterium]
MQTRLSTSIYNPHEQSKEELIEHFAVRQNLFEELSQRLQQSPDKAPLQHYLIEGQRGMGKTTILLRLCYEIERNAGQHTLLPIALKEEAYYAIQQLVQLWESIACELAGKDQGFARLSGQMAAVSHEDSDYERRCFELLRNALRRQGKRLLLFVDNLGELLRNFTPEDQKRLGNLLQRSPYLILVGATATALRACEDISASVLALFEVIHLQGLGPKETEALLLQLGRASKQEERIRRIVSQQPGRIESLRILTGGVIRTMVLLFEVFCDREDGRTLDDLDMVLDRLTPLYKSRMDDLKPLQRTVVNTLALQWEAMTLEEIAQSARFDLNKTARVLEDLKNVFIIEAIASEAAAPLYRLKERFFNIWYLMRLSPGNAPSRVVWLVHFLENWYSASELQQHAGRHLQALSQGRYHSRAAYYLTEAFTQSAQLDQDTEHRMIHTARTLLKENAADLAAALSPSDRDLFSKGERAYQQEAYEDALNAFSQIRQKTQHLNFRIGYASSRIGDYSRAVKAFSIAAEQGHPDALISLGQIYHHQFQNVDEAETCYQRAIEHGRTDAMLYLGNLYHYSMHKPEAAEQHYLQAVKESQDRSNLLKARGISLKGLKNYLITAIKGTAEESDCYQRQDFPGVKENYVKLLAQTAAEALFQLAALYSRDSNRAAEAERYYQKAAESGHAKAALTLADLYNYRDHDYPKAENAYLRAIQHGNVTAMVKLALLYHEVLKKVDRAETYYRMAAERGEMNAMNGLAWLYFEQKRQKEQALAFSRHVIGLEKNIYTAHTAACIFLWNNLIEDAIQTAGEFMYSQEAYQDLEEDILLYLMLLCAKHGEQQLVDYFETPGLKLHERYQPLYYALLSLLGDVNYHKCPPELHAPVQDMLRRIEQLRQDYR